MTIEKRTFVFLKVLLVHEDIHIIRVHSRDSANNEFVSVIQFLQSLIKLSSLRQQILDNNTPHVAFFCLSLPEYPWKSNLP